MAEMNDPMEPCWRVPCEKSVCQVGKSSDLIDYVAKKYKGRSCPKLVSAVKACCHKHLVGCT